MKNRVILNLELDKELKEKIKRIAKKKNISVGALVRLTFSDMKEE